MWTVVIKVPGPEFMLISICYKYPAKFSEIDVVEEDLQRAVKKVICQNMISAKNKTPTGYISLADEIQTDYDSWTEEIEKSLEANNNRCDKSSKNSLTLLKIMTF